MTYRTIHETDFMLFLSSRLGDVIARRKADDREVYFQPGDAGNTLLDVLAEDPPDLALYRFIAPYFN